MSAEMGPPEVAAALGVTRWTAVKLMRSGKVPGAWLAWTGDDGREFWRVARADFEAWKSDRRNHQVHQV